MPKLPEINSEIYKNLQSHQHLVTIEQIIEAKECLSNLKTYVTVEELDEKTNEMVEKTKRIGSDEEISKYTVVIEELELLYKKLEELSSKDASAFSMISGVEGDVGNFSSCVSEISTSTFVS